MIRDDDRATFVFLPHDPRDDGFQGNVAEDVSFEDCDPIWHDGAPCPEQLLGVAQSNPKRFRVFRYDHERREANFVALHGQPISTFSSWADYVMAGMRNRIDDLGKYAPMLRAAWQSHGGQLAEQAGIRDITPSIRRRLMRNRLNGFHLSEDLITCHLFDAFPDEGASG